MSRHPISTADFRPPVAKAKGVGRIAPDLPGSGAEGFEDACVDVFVHAAQLLGIPKSVGEIYGLLFANPEPLAMDVVMARLAISKGSASQGLRWLRENGAVTSVSVAGDRRDHFVAETGLRKLASGFLREQFEPHLANATERLQRLSERTASISPKHRQFYLERLEKMQRWHRFAGQVLPLFLKLTDKV